mmetsp:Transcript_18016/g.51380  ORF Transcript_18016/g.51380 Transcript_18016/m.51380 type:complete len:225 (-) Transcript_18016:423-1097(-)
MRVYRDAEELERKGEDDRERGQRVVGQVVAAAPQRPRPPQERRGHAEDHEEDGEFHARGPRGVPLAPRDLLFAAGRGGPAAVGPGDHVQAIVLRHRRRRRAARPGPVGDESTVKPLERPGGRAPPRAQPRVRVVEAFLVPELVVRERRRRRAPRQRTTQNFARAPRVPVRARPHAAVDGWRYHEGRFAPRHGTHVEVHRRLGLRVAHSQGTRILDTQDEHDCAE